ncbi:hypothetical protein EDC01DRAFT_636733 [Geopyxis carbonaria]|nr:hypothetical protein EDC01DRAFT_636733 [Geopyxis carbonaria]
MTIAPPRSSSSTPSTTATPPPPAPALNGSLRPPYSSTKSHQSGTIENHWNDLPAAFLPTSRSVSPNPATAASAHGTSSSDDFGTLLTELFSASTPTTLIAREHKMCYDRVLKAAPGLSEGQKAELAGVMRPVLEKKETPQWGREKVVEFMMRERGVAGWAAALRRGVECVKWE